MASLYLSLDHIACGLEEVVGDETSLAGIILLAVKDVGTGDFAQSCMSDSVRIVFDEEFRLMMIQIVMRVLWDEYLALAVIEVVLKAAPMEQFVLTVDEEVLRAFFDEGLIWHVRFLIVSLMDPVKS